VAFIWGGARFESQPGHRYPDEGFYGSLEPLQENSGVVSQLVHDRFLPNPFRFIIHHPTIRRYSFWQRRKGRRNPQRRSAGLSRFASLDHLSQIIQTIVYSVEQKAVNRGTTNTSTNSTF
jgi:hypothetical protein